MIKAIIFDIGGVVYTGNMDDFLNQCDSLLEVPNGSFKSLFNKYKDALILGDKSLFDLYFEISKEVSENKYKEKLQQAWLSTMVINKELFELINKLKSKLRIGCLSNSTDFDIFMDKILGTDKIFDPYINSCKIRMKKPDKKIFEFTLKELNIEANECVFIDDKKQFLESARKMGFKVIHYDGNKQLKEKLKVIGIE
ncbi:MAG: HAD-IA family hydrolase [Nanoarchaeota archaeon]|nr:HAD-IA family hydrolase [Nanoarchaeota archaeon]MBU1320969.1 HAD-IA family hydrolase [Nanoarchaeota archaeon]MBU1598354.1 HAD-IA family hydrolase [Nanoarchaeota archaeon]MBU2441744.1 HAD-IA family hydrolase [Nanoarchaeota archaeon]